MKQRVIRNREKLIKLFEKNPPDFSEGKFRGVRLAGGVFRNLNFEKADFCDADLRETDFTELTLSLPILKSKFFKACLQNANLTGALIDMELIYKNADLTRAWLADLTFSGCH